MPEKAEGSQFSRFEKNVENLAQLPILVLKTPEEVGDGQYDMGVILCGDSVVDDLVDYIPDIKQKWIVVSTTQSHIVPQNLGADIHMFSNTDGVPDYLQGKAKEIPFVNVACGHFVNPEIFYPDENKEKVIDVLCIAKWSETKRVELVVQAAELLPDRNFVILGIPMSSERKRAASILYRQKIMEYIIEHNIQNIEFIEPGDTPHVNPDGSVVPGPFTKEQMRDLFQSSKTYILTAYDMEGINRSVAEAICCDVPAVIAEDMIGGTPKLINRETGILAKPDPRAIADALDTLIENRTSLHPREEFLKTYGIEKSNEVLKRAILEVAKNRGVSIDIAKVRNYGGDVWSNDFYRDVAPEPVRQKFAESQVK